jgi:hypothetical protein
MLRWLLPAIGAAVCVAALGSVPRGHVRFGRQAVSPRDTLIAVGMTDTVSGTRARRVCAPPPSGSCTLLAIDPVQAVREKRVEVAYPRAMTSDESATIRLRYTVASDSTVSSPTDSGARRDRTISLSGANFAVKPAESRRVGWRLRDTVSLVWSVLPERPGAHNLVVDVSDFYDEGEVGVTLVDMLSGTRAKVRADEVVLPVDVYTVWGVSERVAQALQAGVAAIGFTLTFVGYSEFRRWLRVRAKAKRPQRPRRPRGAPRDGR